MKNFLVSLFVFTLLSFQIAISQWTLVTNLPITEFVSFASKDSILFAATLSNILYKSTNYGIEWTQIEVGDNNVIFEKIEIIDDILFVGTKNSGIYQSNDNGVTFQKTLVSSLPITDFVKRENQYFASSLGNGVYIFNQQNNVWEEYFSQSLPMNVAGSVSNVLSTKDYLFIASGANGVFHRFSKTDNEWKEGYYYGNLSPGLVVTDAVNFLDTIYVVNGNRVIVSTNDGLTWQDDKLGAINGVDRLIYEGNKDVFLVTSDFQQGTWIQKRNRYSFIGNDWSSDEEYLPNFYCFEMLEFNNKIYLASENGVYYKSTLTTVSPEEESNLVQIKYFSQSNVLKVQSSIEIASITIYNVLGQIVQSQEITATDIQINTQLPMGVYGIKVDLTNGETLYKTIHIE